MPLWHASSVSAGQAMASRQYCDEWLIDQ